METPAARAGVAAIVLALYYWLLTSQPFAPPANAADLRLQDDIRDSRALFDANRFADALAPTKRLTIELPTQAVYHERHARILHELKRPADEAQAWEHMMESTPTPVDACPMVAEAYNAAGAVEKALATYERCAALPPQNPDFLLYLGQALLRADRKAEARSAFERGLLLDDSYPDLHLLLGIRRFDDGDLPGARESFEKFAALSPSRMAEVEPWLQRTEPKK